MPGVPNARAHRRGPLIAAALVAGIGWAAQASTAGALPSVPSPTYTIRTALAQPGFDRVRTTEAVLYVPTPVDVDGDLAPDVVVHLTIDAGRAHLRTLRLPSTPASLPVQVEAILDDPRGNGAQVAFGFDARSSTAPDDVEESLSLITDAQRLGSFALDLATVSPGNDLAVIAALFTPGPDDARIDPLSARIDLSPVPAALHAGLVLGSDLGLTTSRLDVVTDRATTVGVIARDRRGDDEDRLTLDVDRLPNSLSVSMTDAPTGRRSFDYVASDRIAEVEASLASIRGGTTTDESTLVFEDMPTRVTFTQDSSTQGTLDAPGVIGALEVGTTSGGPLVRLPDPAYVSIAHVGEHRSTNVRLLGVSHAEYASGAELSVALTARAGPFIARIVDGARVIDATVTDLPSDVRFTFWPAGNRMTYEGSARIQSVHVVASDPQGIAGRATELRVDLLDVPSTLELVFDEDAGTVALTACPDDDPNACVGRALGALDVSASSGSALTLPAGVDGIAFEDTPARYALAAHLTALKRVRVTSGDDGTGLTIVKAPGPFDVHLLQGARATDITVRDLPSSVSANFDATGTLTYSASAGIGELTGSITDPAGVAGRATSASVTLRDLPSALSVSWSSSDGVVGADAGDQTIGLLEFLLTSGPVESLPADRDGVVLRDEADRYVVFGRLTGLKKISASLDPPDATIETLGGRILAVDLQENGEYTRVTLDRLTPSVRVRFAESGGRRDIVYTASAATNSLTFDTNTGDRGNLHASIANPLPASVSFCAAQDLACTPPGDRGGRGEADAGSFRLAASEHTTVNLLDCVRPLSGCTRGNASEFTAVENMRVRVLGFDADSNDPVGYSGHIYLDTDDHELTGHILNIAGSGGFEASFPAGFRAQNRLGTWSFWGVSKSKCGSISFPGGTSLDVRVIGIWIGVTSYLC